MKLNIEERIKHLNDVHELLVVYVDGQMDYEHRQLELVEGHLAQLKEELEWAEYAIGGRLGRVMESVHIAKCKEADLVKNAPKMPRKSR